MVVKFYINLKKKNTKDNPEKIYIRVRDGRDIDLRSHTQLFVLPSHWKKEGKGTTSRKFGKIKSDYKAFRDNSNTDKKLNEIQEKVETTYNKNKASAKWLELVIDEIINPVKYKPKVVTLFSFIENFIGQSKTRVNPKTNNVISYKQQRDYVKTFEDFKEFCKHKRKQYNFCDIDLDFYKDFMEFLQKKNLAQNTIGKKFRFLKIFLNAATEEGYNTNLRYTSKRFISVSEKTENVYLDENELQQIYDLDLSENPRLDKVRDVFLVACWTGLRYGDLRNIPGNVNGDFIEIEQSKTGNEVIIPLHHTVKATLKKYDNNLPKPISNQKFNDYVKDVVKLAGINEGFHKAITKGGQKISTKYEKWELVSSHTGRRSFATNLYKQGFPSYSIMQITGHKTETAFLKYIKVTPKEHAEKLKAFWLKQKSHLKIA